MKTPGQVAFELRDLYAAFLKEGYRTNWPGMIRLSELIDALDEMDKLKKGRTLFKAARLAGLAEAQAVLDHDKNLTPSSSVVEQCQQASVGDVISPKRALVTQAAGSIPASESTTLQPKGSEAKMTTENDKIRGMKGASSTLAPEPKAKEVCRKCKGERSIRCGVDGILYRKPCPTCFGTGEKP